MSVTQEPARTVRPAHEVRGLPAGQVPTKPTISWFKNFRHAPDQQSGETRVIHISSLADPGTGIPRATHPKRRTVEVKANILQKLLNPERGTVHDLGIKTVDGQFSDKEAEKQYQDFIKQLMIWSRDLAQPQNDPFHEFNEYHTFTFKKVYREVPAPNKDPELRPYICIVGFKSEEEVKRAHAQLASKRVQGRHCPCLSFCYDLDGGQLSDMPRASFLRDTQRHTLCGSLVSIGEGRERRIVTIGGLVTDGEVTWALTVGHLPKEAQRSRSGSETLTENDLDISDYSEDVEPPLILRAVTTSSDTELEPPTSYKPESSDPDELGDIEISGGDWSLIRLKHETLALPNFTTSEDQQSHYLFKYAESLRWDDSDTKYLDVAVLGGVTGPSQCRLLNETSPMRLPGGKWINAWVAEAQSESQLQRGDSGSWVVDIKNGIVYGHVLSISRRTIYILSLADIFRQISEKTPTMKLDLVQPFDSLKCLSTYYYYSKHDLLKSKDYAEKALQIDVVRAFQKRSTTNTHRVSEFIQWASSNLSLKVDDYIYSDFPPNLTQTLPPPGKRAEQWSDWYSLEMAAPGPSRVSFVNPSAEKLQGKGHSPDRLHGKHPNVGDWEANSALDTPIDEWLFLEQIRSLTSMPQPASYLEILNFSDPRNSVVESRGFSDIELEPFLINKALLGALKGPHKLPVVNGMRLVIQEDVRCPGAFSYNVITVSSNTMKLLVQEMSLPLVAVEASSALGPFFWWKYDDEPEDPRLQIIFRESQDGRLRSSEGWELILSYSFKTRITYGYVRWTADGSISPVLRRLVEFSKKSAHPLMLPILVLLHNLGERNDGYYENIEHEIDFLESTMRYGSPGEQEKVLRNAIQCRNRLLRKRPQTWLHIIDKVTRAMDCYWSCSDQAHKTREQEELHQMLVSRLSFLTGKLESTEHYTYVSNERLQGLIESVRLLRSTKEPNSNREEPLRLLLAIFLPGTLVASFFSTSFFNFNNNTSGSVSNKIWVYFVVVIPLTIIVLGAEWAYGAIKKTLLKKRLRNGVYWPEVQRISEAIRKESFRRGIGNV